MPEHAQDPQPDRRRWRRSPATPASGRGRRPAARARPAPPDHPRARRAREHPAQEPRQPRRVQQHVHRDHDHQHQVEQALEHADQHPLGDGHRLAGVRSAGPASRPVAAPGRPAVATRSPATGRARRASAAGRPAAHRPASRSAGRGAELVLDHGLRRLHLASRSPCRRSRPAATIAIGEREVDQRTPPCARGMRSAAEGAHDRVQQDRDQRRDHEDEHRMADGGHELPGPTTTSGSPTSWTQRGIRIFRVASAGIAAILAAASEGIPRGPRRRRANPVRARSRPASATLRP